MKHKIKSCLLVILMIGAPSLTNQLVAQETGKSEWVAPTEANQLINPIKGNPDATKAGKKLYNSQCAVCHGDSGKGDGVAGLALNPKPASFQSEQVQKQKDGVIFWKITNGRAPMAAYKDILSEDQRWQLVNYIRTFSK